MSGAFMNLKNSYYSGRKTDNLSDERSGAVRHFFWPFKRRKYRFLVRGGAMSPDELKKKIESIGVGKQIEISRVGYDGALDDMPI